MDGDAPADDRVSAALDAAFPDRPVASLGATGPSWNDDNRTVSVAFADGGAAYLKAVVAGDGSAVARERAALAHVGARGAVPVPDVLAADADADPPYLATAPVDGRPLHRAWGEADAAGRAALTRAAGRTLAAVHAERFDAHGHVGGGGAGDLDIDRGPWTDVLRDRVELLRGLATGDRFGDHFDAVADAVEANRDLLDDAPAALVHGDPAAPNGFLADSAADTAGSDDGERVGLLDWELVHVGDPARELVRARRQLLGGTDGAADERLVAALHDGYRERADPGSLPAGFEARRPVYEAVEFLGVSGYVERVADLRDEPLDEFAARVDAEMERRLARVT